MADKNQPRGGATALRCSFCARAEGEVDRLLAGPQVFICAACVRLAAKVLDDEPKQLRAAEGEGSLPATLGEMQAFVGRHVPGEARQLHELSAELWRFRNNWQTPQHDGSPPVEAPYLAWAARRAPLALQAPTCQGWRLQLGT